jgi:hypothetical protein
VQEKCRGARRISAALPINFMPVTHVEQTTLVGFYSRELHRHICAPCFKCAVYQNVSAGAEPRKAAVRLAVPQAQARNWHLDSALPSGNQALRISCAQSTHPRPSPGREPVTRPGERPLEPPESGLVVPPPRISLRRRSPGPPRHRSGRSPSDASGYDPLTTRDASTPPARPRPSYQASLMFAVGKGGVQSRRLSPERRRSRSSPPPIPRWSGPSLCPDQHLPDCESFKFRSGFFASGFRPKWRSGEYPLSLAITVVGLAACRPARLLNFVDDVFIMVARRCVVIGRCAIRLR